MQFDLQDQKFPEWPADEEIYCSSNSSITLRSLSISTGEEKN